MDQGKIIRRRAGQYIVRIIIGGKLYEYETTTKRAAKKLLEKIKEENKDI